jgi:hypothetical protein
MIETVAVGMPSQLGPQLGSGEQMMPSRQEAYSLAHLDDLLPRSDRHGGSPLQRLLDEQRRLAGRLAGRSGTAPGLGEDVVAGAREQHDREQQQRR